MKNLISVDLVDQVMHCRVCSEPTEIPRCLMRDQDGLLQMAEYLADDHRECAANPDNPQLARLSREFRKRVHRENDKAAARKAA